MDGIAWNGVAGQNACMDNELPLLTALNEASETLGSLAKLILLRDGEFATTWECANRVCDRYYVAQAA